MSLPIRKYIRSHCRLRTFEKSAACGDRNSSFYTSWFLEPGGLRGVGSSCKNRIEIVFTAHLQDLSTYKNGAHTKSMPYPERIRDWWLRVAGNGNEANARCQVETYTEKRGFVECLSPRNLQVHHLYPEALAKENGINPDDVPALVACDTHHIGPLKEPDNLPFTGSFTFHPDMGRARTLYKHGDKQSFARTAAEHAQAAERGERYWGGDQGSDQYYMDKVQRKATIYQYTHPEDPKPTVKHRKPNHKPRRRWFSDIT